MTGRNGLPQTPVWVAAASGWLVHDPGAMNWGPIRACPVSVAIAPADDDPPRHRSVEVAILAAAGGTEGTAMLNPGAARWLGNRLIEAAVLAETRQEAGAAQLAALAAADQDPA